ncbi:DUF4160 domain-containing protein [Acidobacteria bacterium AH-259-A15]|nr:DUF4160 domain-containing protein [Acidobacteria bacterium AH-259-A15]
MPEISRFYGIVIKMFFDDHEPPHFHVEYAEHQAVEFTPLQGQYLAFIYAYTKIHGMHHLRLTCRHILR